GRRVRAKPLAVPGSRTERLIQTECPARRSRFLFPCLLSAHTSLLPPAPLSRLHSQLSPLYFLGTAALHRTSLAMIIEEVLVPSEGTFDARSRFAASLAGNDAKAFFSGLP